jgi:putative FmdB family regulatory protein
MPFYEYLCNNCGYKKTMFLPISQSDSKQQCPKCRDIMMKQITTTHFMLQGGGWAKDGYKK